MNPVLDTNLITTILLDIEGTTTPVDFVYQVLFPFAHSRMQAFLLEQFSDEEVQNALSELHREHLQDQADQLHPPPLADEPPTAQIESLVGYLHWLMERDRKSTPLKILQGKIWEAGYASGELRGEVFADVPTAFARWHQQGKAICIYSSGSVLAQKLIFSHTAYGDLTPYISAYFDTNIGGKKEVESYKRIAELLNCAPSNLLFISDVTNELDAARAANLQTLCSVRPGNQPIADFNQHAIIFTFDKVAHPHKDEGVER